MNNVLSYVECVQELLKNYHESWIANYHISQREDCFAIEWLNINDFSLFVVIYADLIAIDKVTVVNEQYNHDEIEFKIHGIESIQEQFKNYFNIIIHH